MNTWESLVPKGSPNRILSCRVIGTVVLHHADYPLLKNTIDQLLLTRPNRKLDAQVFPGEVLHRENAKEVRFIYYDSFVLAIHGIGNIFHFLDYYLFLNLFRHLDVDIGPNYTTVETADDSDVPIWQEDPLPANIDHGSKPQAYY